MKSSNTIAPGRPWSGGLISPMRGGQAPENKKLDLIAAAVTHMVEQRTAMNVRKAKMDEEMMKHMMQHMQMGKESMSGSQL